MRKLIGGLVLAAGVGTLGWWGTAHNATNMEADIRAAAQSAIGATTHPVHAVVGGRDITVSGLANSDAEKEAILSRLNNIDGRRVVRSDELAVLERAAPFVFSAHKTADGTVYAGNTPTAVHRQVFSERIGDAASGLTLAAGVPDAQWPGVVGQGLDALSALKSGSLMIEDQAIALSGLAALPPNKDAALAALAGLPEGYTFSDAIDLEDDGTPMRLTLRKGTEGITAVGKMPAGTDLASLGAGVNAQAVQIARIAAPQADWVQSAQNGVAALSDLIDGTLTIVDQDLSLNGTAMRAGKMQAEDRLAALPGSYAVNSDIALYDDGAPIALDISTEGDRPSVSGKAPYGFDLASIQAALGADMDTSQMHMAEIDGPAGFTALIEGALPALPALETGHLTVSDGSVTLRGVARTPTDAEAGQAQLAKLPQDTAVTADITHLDDGTPPTWQYAYADDGSAVISGKLPHGLMAGDIPSLIGVPQLDADVTEGLMGTADTAKAALSQMAPWMADLEAATITGQGDAVSISAVAKLDVAVDALRAAMTATVDAPVTVEASENAVLYGTVRKLENGRIEQFTAEGWVVLPELDLFNFEPSVVNCDARSRRVLLLEKINFVTGGSQVDATSEAVLNDLSKIIQRCFGDGSLIVEIGGHTDNVGGDEGNMALSIARAETVAATLAGLGIDVARLTAKGYGEGSPLADNATDAGRAMNRRTEFTWSSINLDN